MKFSKVAGNLFFVAVCCIAAVACGTCIGFVVVAVKDNPMAITAVIFIGVLAFVLAVDWIHLGENPFQKKGNSRNKSRRSH